MKKPFKIISKDARGVTYEADFWEGPLEAGETGRYVRRRFTASSLSNVSPSVSYYDELKRALR